MLKLVASIIIASLIALILEPYLSIVLHWLVQLHHFIYEQLSVVFSSGKVGTILRNIVTLLFIPFIASGIPTLCYYLVYRKRMPYFNEVTWAVWIVMATIVLLK